MRTYIHFRNGAVLIDSGAFILPVRDLEIPIGGSSFVIERSFSNTPSSRGIFGVGWTFNFGMRLEEKGEQILVIEPGAGATLFRKISDGRYVHEALGYQVVTKNGYFYPVGMQTQEQIDPFVRRGRTCA